MSPSADHELTPCEHSVFQMQDLCPKQCVPPRGLPLREVLSAQAMSSLRELHQEAGASLETSPSPAFPNSEAKPQKCRVCCWGLQDSLS